MPRRQLPSVVTLAILIALAAVPVVAHWQRLAATPVEWISHRLADQRDNDRQGNELRYEVLLPADFNPEAPYPVLLYLHQLDMGNDRRGLLRQVDAWFAVDDFRTRHPAIVVVPMLDQTNDPGGRLMNFGGKREGQAGEADTIAALRQVMAQYRVDPARIYVTGNSMGGMGTWELLLSYNAPTGTRAHIFAGGMPLAGRHATADPEAAAQALRQVPIWAIHGARDPEVSPTWDRTLARLLAAESTFRYTEDPELGHDVWDRYYTRAEVWDWLFAQRAPP